MALVNNREGKGGRKPVVIENPFYFENKQKAPCNVLWYDNARVELLLIDLITGVIRAFNAEAPVTKKQEYVNWCKVLKLYKDMSEMTRQGIQDKLICSLATAKRYVQVVKLCNLFIKLNPMYANIIQEQEEFENATGIHTERDSASESGDRQTGPRDDSVDTEHCEHVSLSEPIES